jgi:hypothetical protein
MPELKELYDLVTAHAEPDLDAWREQERRQRTTTRNKGLGAYALAAALGLAVVAAFLGSRELDAPEPRTPEPPVTAAETAASNFVQAFGALDVDLMARYLADDADLSGLVGSLGTQSVGPTLGELRLMSAFLDAVGYRQAVGDCVEQRVSTIDTRFSCPFRFHILRSHAIGLGPFDGGSFDLTVRDGRVVRASVNLFVGGISQQIWEPFAEWVATRHPGDVAIMYVDETHSGVRLTAQSIRAWERLSRAYVMELTRFGRETRFLQDVSTVGPRGRALRFSFQPPTGWGRRGNVLIVKDSFGPQNAEALIFWTNFPDGYIALPCDYLQGLSDRASPADLAHAVSVAPGTELVAGPSDVSVGGFTAKHVVLTVREDVGCDPGFFYAWQDTRGGPFWAGSNVGDTIRVWILDVDGTRVVIVAETTVDAGAELEREIQKIVDSIRFFE